MVQRFLLANEVTITKAIVQEDENGELPNKKAIYEKLLFKDNKITSSMSFNCLIENEFSNNKNNNDSIDSIRSVKTFNNIYNIKEAENKSIKEFEISKNKAISTSKIDKCVRFNDDIKITEINDEYDRRPMPLAKMYYKDEVELLQLREEMKQIQYRIANKIEGKLLLG